ncbi:MAG TPA: hypothetical protein PK787_11235 [Burkholderiaceae bacterium]|jgi:hypothetical protein|nr:hypothetical protein [Burkholderiaceae bacterium]
MSEAAITTRSEGEGDTCGRKPEGAARAAPVSPARRSLAKALAAGVLALGAGAALAQPIFGARMSPDERERLRRELRQQQEQGRRGGDPDGRRERMSPRERDQLRQQLRDARPDERRGGRGRRRD